MFLIENIFVQFGGLLFQQTIDISIGTNCAPLHVYEAEYLQGLITNKDRKLSQTFNSNFRYIDSVNDQFSIPWLAASNQSKEEIE